MTELELGDRHSRQLDGLGADAEIITVLLRAGNVTDQVNRQHMLVCLTNLLARLHGVVRAIQVDVDGTIAVVRPNGAGVVDAMQTLESMATWANGGRIPVLRHGGAADIVVDLTGEGHGGADLYCWGSGWKAWICHEPRRFDGNVNRRECIGPYLAACLVAGEIFKRAKGLKKGRFTDNDAYSLWDGTAGRWEELDNGPNLAGTHIPPLYLIGAGAVGQGFIQILGANELGDAFVVSVDHDHHDKEGTNLNRCFLAGIDDIGGPKTDAVSRYRALSALGGIEHTGTLRDYIGRTHPGLHPQLANMEANDEYDLVVSAVDIDNSRQDIQGLHPRIVLGGSTDSLRAQSVIYGMVEGAECLGCWNVPTDNLVRAAQREAALRAMSEADRLRELAGNVNDLDAAMAFLASGQPKCGQMGERDVKSFVARMPPEFSVSFVSMTAAVLAASDLFRVVLDRATIRLPKTIFQFKNLSMAGTATPRRDGCPYCSGR